MSDSNNDFYSTNKEFNQNNPTSYENLNIADKVLYKNKLKELNLTLTMNQFPEVSDFYDFSLKSVLRNMKVFLNVLEDRHKIMEQKKEMQFKLSRYEGENTMFNDKLEKQNLKIKELTEKSEYYKNQLNLLKEKKDKEIDKTIKDKEEAIKSLTKITFKESQYKHTIKQLEAERDKVKESLKKFMNDNKEIRINDNKNEKIMINNGTVIFDNFLKNSPSIILNQINYSKDFYNLIFKSFNEKFNQISQENKDLKECLKSLREEITSYIELKKQILYKFASDKFESDSLQLKNAPDFINLKIFDLDFITAKDDILLYFNEVIDNFRFLLMYDIYKINHESEFKFEEVKNTFKNKNYDLQNIPYYEKIKSSVERLNLDRLEEVKKDIEIRLKDKKPPKNDLDLNIPDLHFQENEINQCLDDLGVGMDENIANIEDQFKVLDEYIMNEIKSCSEIVLETEFH